jgi:hypothetical protein
MAVSFLAVPIATCGQQRDVADKHSFPCAKLQVYDPNHAVEDAQAAAISARRELLAVRGYVVETPGVAVGPSVLGSGWTIKIIAGTSDAHTSKECALYDADVREYASSFNREVLRIYGLKGTAR